MQPLAMQVRAPQLVQHPVLLAGLLSQVARPTGLAMRLRGDTTMPTCSACMRKEIIFQVSRSPRDKLSRRHLRRRATLRGHLFRPHPAHIHRYHLLIPIRTVTLIFFMMLDGMGVTIGFHPSYPTICPPSAETCNVKAANHIFFLTA